MENQGSQWNILFIDDDPDDFVLTRAMLEQIEKHQIQLEWAKNFQEGLHQLTAYEWDAVLVDYDLGLENGVQLIREAVSQGVAFPLIMVTGRGKYEVDVEAMQAGAYDYVTKAELTSSLLERIIRYAKERQRTEKMLEQIVQARTEELQTAMEELQVMDDELRTQLEETLRLQEEREATSQLYRNLFDFAPSAYLVTDPLGAILDANLAATTLLNKRKDTLVGKPLAVFVPKENRPAFRSKISRLAQSRAIQEWDLCLKPFSMDVVQVQVIASPIRGMDERLVAIHWLMYKKKTPETG